MTDKEIIKALECCRDKIFKGCDNCPMDEDNDCIEIVCANAVDFINRQQAEIDRLKAEHEKTTVYCANLFDKYEKTKIAKESLENTFKDVRTEAIKEFAKKVENKLGIPFMVNNQVVGIVLDETIEEMAGAE